MTVDLLPGPPALTAMTSRQQRVFDELLAIGVPRPFTPVGLVETLTSDLTAGLRPVLARWPDGSLWVSKSAMMSVRRCEAGFLLSRSNPPQGTSRPALVGDLSHRAIQLAYTHPGHPIAQYVREASTALHRGDERFAAWWDGATMAEQSDVLVAVTSTVTSFVDSWPAIQPSWEPRFEETAQAKIAGVTLSARLDLVLGRPRPSGQRSMVLVDWKSGAVRDEHTAEARFHALVATLSHGVPPWRSVVYSLTSGQYVTADDPTDLHLAVAETITAVTAMVDLLTERRAPQVTCGHTWCPACGQGT